MYRLVRSFLFHPLLIARHFMKIYDTLNFYFCPYFHSSFYGIDLWQPMIYLLPSMSPKAYSWCQSLKRSRSESAMRSLNCRWKKGQVGNIEYVQTCKQRNTTTIIITTSTNRSSSWGERERYNNERYITETINRSYLFLKAKPIPPSNWIVSLDGGANKI